MKILTLSFLTESKASHACLSSIRRVAITLLVMLLTTASAWAQFFPQTKYYLYLNENYQGGGIGTVEVDISEPTTTYTLASYDEPTRTGYMFCGWSTSSTGTVKYRTNDPITLTGNLTLYAVWEETTNVSELKYTITDEVNRQVMVTGYEEYPKGTLNIPATTTRNGIEYSVTSIGFSAFFGCSNLKSVTIPNSVTSIGNYAFFKCSSLQSVTIPNSVTSIGNNAFSDCSSLQSVTIPNSVTTIGIHAFDGCSYLQSVTIPNSVTSIGDNVFSGCSYLQSITIPNSVTSIGNDAFRYCSSLQSVTIPNSVTTIGIHAFSDCSSLQSVTIPNSVTSIGDYAFNNCLVLRSVTIPNSVTSIGEYAFKGCSELQSVTINGNPNIGDNAFSETPATVTMNLTVSQIGNDYWTTFYNEGYNFQADGNTTVYKGTVNESSLMLTEVKDKIVNSGTAVILKSSGKPVMTLTESGSSDTNGNDLQGISERCSRIGIIRDLKVNEIYTMGNTPAGFGFHRYTGEYVPAGKAFLPLYIENEAKAQSLTIVFAIGATGIKSVSSDSDVQNDWFSLDGTRLSGKPSQPGIYIKGKKKVVIK